MKRSSAYDVIIKELAREGLFEPADLRRLSANVLYELECIGMLPPIVTIKGKDCGNTINFKWEEESEQ